MCAFDLCSSSSSAGVDHVVTAWCVDKQLRLAVMQGHRARVTGVTYIPQHGQFATSSFDKTVRLWDADHFTPVAEVGAHILAAKLEEGEGWNWNRAEIFSISGREFRQLLQRGM